MALSKVDYNSLNVTPVASKALKWNSTPNGFETGDVGGSLVLLETQTASSSSTISFTSNIDSTYSEYVFKFINIHPATETSFTFQADTGTNTNYNQTIQSTYFRATHREDAGEADLYYNQSNDQANGTAFQTLVESPQIGANNDENLNGYLHIFNPSSSVFTKHFIARISTQNDDGQPGYVMQVFTAGYFNTATALTRFQFKMGSGNIDAGDICLYGIS